MIDLNRRAYQLVEQSAAAFAELGIERHETGSDGTVWDFGVTSHGGLEAGLLLARACMSDLARISVLPGELAGIDWPQVHVLTDFPVEACLFSQYAGWQIATDDYFAMGSGPMRAACATEELFEHFEYREVPQKIVGVLESGSLPDAGAIEYIAGKTSVGPAQITLLVAPTSSPAGNLQVVARSVETCLHKLFELGFDVTRIRSAAGSAPLAPVAADDLTGIGRTNDAILYGGRVTLWVTGDDDSLQEVGPRVPASATDAYGQPFLQIFEAAGRDFYQIDPHLFSPAQVVFQNIDTGHVHAFGDVNHGVLRESFGLA